MPISLKSAALMLPEWRRYWNKDVFLAHSLICIIPYLPDQLLAKAWDIAVNIEEITPRAETLVELASRANCTLQQSRINQALEIAYQVEEPLIKAGLLFQLATLLNEDNQEIILNDAIEIAEQVTQDPDRKISVFPDKAEFFDEAPAMAPCLVTLIAQWQHLRAWIPLRRGYIRYVDAELAGVEKVVLSRFSRGFYSRYRVYSRVAMLEYLPQSLSPNLLTKVTKLADSIKYEKEKIEAHIVLAIYLPERERVFAIEKIQGWIEQVENPSDRTELYMNLASRINDLHEQIVFCNKAFEAAQSINDSNIQLIKLVRLALAAPTQPSNFKEVVRQLVKDKLSDWIEKNTTITPVNSSFINTLAILAPLLEKAEHFQDVKKQVLEKTLRGLAKHSRLDFIAALDALLPTIITYGGRETADEIAYGIFEAIEWWP